VWSAWQQTGDGAVHTTVGDLLRWSGAFVDEPAASGVGSAAWDANASMSAHDQQKALKPPINADERR